MNSRTYWLVVAIAVVLSGWLGWQRFTAPPVGNFAGSTLGGPFALVDQDGKTRRDSDFKGQYRLMYFGYTFCPAICPTDVALIAKGLKAYERERPRRAAKVTPIFVTIDPERDDPASLKAFVSAFHPRLVGLTGPPATVADMLRRYGIDYRRVETGDPADYDFNHHVYVYLLGPAGEPIAYIEGQPTTAAEITALLETYVR